MAQKKTKKKTGTKRGSVKTQDAIKAIREAHKIGKLLLQKTPNPVHGDRSAEKAAKKYGISPSTVLKRRVLVKTFPDLSDLYEYFQLMREHDSPVGVSLFTRALESGDKRPASQKKLLRRVIIEKLSRQQIEQILRDSFGTRRQGGPKHKIETASQFLAELERTSITVNRLCDQAVEDGADYFDQLPETLQHQIKSLRHLTKAMISAIEAERKDRKKK